jgi:alkylhydroperoxidase/carboxymuconolactone decarboxylase family protein YurZ
MAEPPKRLNNVDYLRSFNAGSAEAFQALRKAVMAGPLDAHTCELITLGALATTGEEDSFKVHARRLLSDGVSVDAVRQAVLVTFTATTTFSQVVAALRWVDDLAAPT